MVMTSSATNEKTIDKFVEMSLVLLLLEILVDKNERHIYEKSLGILDGICNSEKEREKAYNNALTMPVVVKKILRVSEVATEFSISILWNLCMNEKGEEKTAWLRHFKWVLFRNYCCYCRLVIPQNKEEGNRVVEVAES